MTRERWRAAMDKAQKSALMESASGFAFWAALAGTLFAAPALFDSSDELVGKLARHFYGTDWEDAIVGLWWIATFPLSFFLLRAAFISMVTMIIMMAIHYGPRLGAVAF